MSTVYPPTSRSFFPAAPPDATHVLLHRSCASSPRGAKAIGYYRVSVRFVAKGAAPLHEIEFWSPSKLEWVPSTEMRALDDKHPALTLVRFEGADMSAPPPATVVGGISDVRINGVPAQVDRKDFPDALPEATHVLFHKEHGVAPAGQIRFYRGAGDLLECWSPKLNRWRPSRSIPLCRGTDPKLRLVPLAGPAADVAEDVRKEILEVAKRSAENFSAAARKLAQTVEAFAVPYGLPAGEVPPMPSDMPGVLAARTEPPPPAPSASTGQRPAGKPAPLGLGVVAAQTRIGGLMWEAK